MTQEPTVPVLHSSGSLKAQSLQREEDKILEKCAVKIANDRVPANHNRLFLAEKASGRWRSVIDLSPLDTFIVLFKFMMETIASVPATIKKGDSGQKDLPVQNPLLWPFYSTPGLHQNVHSDIDIGSSTGYMLPSILSTLAGCNRFSTPFVRAPSSPTVLSTSGDCYQHGEVEPWANSRAHSLSWNAGDTIW